MQKVAIVGAGPAGIIAAKVLLTDGFDVTVFERNTTLGGIWSTDGAYYDLHTQQPGGTIEFSDLYDGEEYASWQHVYKYLRKYADRFDITSHIRLRNRVLSISKSNLHDAKEPWSIKVEQINETSSLIETFTFDFVVISSGLFSSYHKPSFRGQEKFSGSILHANDVKTREQLTGKNVAVVGGSKSAIDMATSAATINGRCDMVFRRIHSILPTKMLRGRLPIKYLLSRFNTLFAYPYPLAPHGRLFQFIHNYFPRILEKIRMKIAADLVASNGPELYDDGVFQLRHTLKDGLVTFPVQPIFTELKRQNRIQGHIGWIEEIADSNTIRLNTGKLLSPIDTIICATGHYFRFLFFSDADACTMGLPHEASEDLNLYRRIVPIDVPKIAFLGYISSSGAWMIDEVAAHWASDYFKGIQLCPSREEMQKEIVIIRNFVRNRYGATAPHIRFYFLELIEIYLHDMGLPLIRTNNWLTENFGVYRPNRFKTLHEERRARDHGLPFPNQFYLSFLHCVLIFFAAFGLIFSYFML